MNKKIHIKPKGCNLTAKRGTRIHVDDSIITFVMQVCKAVLCKKRAFTYVICWQQKQTLAFGRKSKFYRIAKESAIIMKIKKMLSLAVAGTMMLLSMVVSAGAIDVNHDAQSPASDSNVAVVNLSDNITSQQLQEITSATSACIKQKDGTTIPVDSVVTVEDVSMPASLADTGSTSSDYKVILSATASDEKIVADSGEKNGGTYNVAATLQMIWIDGPGLDNVIKEVSGTSRVLKGTMASAEVQWGNGWKSAVTWTSKNVINRSSFLYRPNETVPCPKAQYAIMMNGAMSDLVLTVSSSVLQ